MRKTTELKEKNSADQVTSALTQVVTCSPVQSDSAPARPVTIHSVSEQTDLSPTLPESPDTSSPALRQRIKSLQAKQRADAFINSIDIDTAMLITRWLGEIENTSEVHRRVTSPPPEGLGLTVNFSTLLRLRNSLDADDLVLCTNNMFDVIDDLEHECDLNQTPRIQAVISHLLHEKAFELARKHPGSDVLKVTLTSIQKIAELDYKRQKLLLEREKLLREPVHNSTQHHRVDLNIVPPARPAANTAVVHSRPDAPLDPPNQQLPPPNTHQKQSAAW